MEVLRQCLKRVDQSSIPTVRLTGREWERELRHAEQVLDDCDAFDNVVTRESWTVHDGAGTGCWEMFEQMAPSGFVNVAHVHPVQDELILVLRGHVRLLVHDVWRNLQPGDAVTVPAGVSHGLDNPFAEPVLMRVRYTPAAAHQTAYFRALAECSQLGFMSASGIPHPLYCALLFRMSPDLVSFWWFPPTLMWLYALLFAPIAWACGFSLDELHAAALAKSRRKAPRPDARVAATGADRPARQPKPRGASRSKRV